MYHFSTSSPLTSLVPELRWLKDLSQLRPPTRVPIPGFFMEPWLPHTMAVSEQSNMVAQGSMWDHFSEQYRSNVSFNDLGSEATSTVLDWLKQSQVQPRFKERGHKPHLSIGIELKNLQLCFKTVTYRCKLNVLTDIDICTSVW